MDPVNSTCEFILGILREIDERRGYTAPEVSVITQRDRAEMDAACEAFLRSRGLATTGLRELIGRECHVDRARHRRRHRKAA